MSGTSDGRGSRFAVRSLRGRNTLLACALVLGTALVVGGFYYNWIVDLTLERALERRAVEARLMAPQVREAYDRMRHDAVAISQMPPFQGIIRSLRNGGADPKDGSTYDDWRERLETIFAAIMLERSDYVQMRYIGLADGGRELVRTDAIGGDIFHTQGERLQRKASQPYFQAGLKLSPGDVYFSAITSNRDFGEIQDNRPMLRVVAPVRDRDGVLFGFMVINAHFGHLIENVIGRMETEHEFFVVTDSGDFVRRRPGEGQVRLTRGVEANPATPPEIVRLVLDGRVEDGAAVRHIGAREVILSAATLNFDAGGVERFAKVLVLVPLEEALAPAFETRTRILLLTLPLVLVAALVAYFASLWLLRPLKTLAAGVEAFDAGNEEPDLPVDRGDEVGEVSRSFAAVVARLNRAYRDERDASERLRQSNRALDEFAYIASHDLKEPIRAINNHVQFLEEDHGEILPEDAHRRIGRLKTLCARADRLISDLLQYSRLTNGEMTAQPVDVEAVVQEIRENLSETLRERGASIEIVTPLPSLTGDRTRIASLFHNLVVNGIKYNDRPDPSIEIGFRERCGKDGRPAYFVRDNGIGIAPEFADSVFRIFKRLNSDKAYGAGTGAGLSFARKIAERHGGELWFESPEEGGTIFYYHHPEVLP